MKAILEKPEPDKQNSSSNYFEQVVGIMGGVGPEATNYFTSLLVKLRLDNAKRDQDHIPYLVFNNPQIPDRTAHLVKGKQSPLPELLNTANVLKKAGSTFLVIPCNTCHPFAEEIEKTVGLIVLNMITLTVQNIIDNFGTNAKVGLLATDGTVKTQIYQNEFGRISNKIQMVLPTPKTQKNIMKAIYEIKSTSVNSNNINLLLTATEELIQKGANVVILGCTEIPLALTKNKRLFPIVDPMEILAKAVIEKTLSSKIRSFKNFWQLSPATQ